MIDVIVEDELIREVAVLIREGDTETEMVETGTKEGAEITVDLIGTGMTQGIGGEGADQEVLITE